MWRRDVMRKAVIVLLTLAAAWTMVEWLLVLWLGSTLAPHPLYYVSLSGDWGFGYRLNEEIATLEWRRDSPPDTPRRPCRVGGIARFGFVSGGVWLYSAGYVVERDDIHSVFCFSFLAIALFAAYPTLAFIRAPLRRYRRRKRGLCLKCGYNLTGKTSGVCPECGTEVET